MTIETLLGSLKNVRQVSSQRWMAACPAHADRSPSLSIRETQDGRILLYDFGGCDVHTVLASIGLTAADLFPRAASHHVRGEKPNHWHAALDALRVQAQEALIVAVAAENIAKGAHLTQGDRDRVLLAAQRLRTSLEMCR